MTMWEFHARMDGWRLINGVRKSGKSMSEERAEELGIVGF